MMTSTIKVPSPETRADAVIERRGAREAQPGSEVKLAGKDHIIVGEDDVLGVLEEESR